VLAKLRSKLSYANIMATVAVFMALGGGVAWALGTNSVKSKHIAPDAAKGVDIKESSLDEVPAATLGGLGGESPGGAGPCDPETAEPITCATVSTTLPAPSRVLVIGQIRAEPDSGGGNGGGECGVGESQLSTMPVFVNDGQTDVITITGVTDVVGPGPASFGLYCWESASGIRYFNGRLSLVALSPSAAP
jgi:hypothetical protein